jgi:hypothetical protein
MRVFVLCALFSTLMMASARQTLDVLRATAAELRTLLDAGNITSVELVKTYLSQIALHNHSGMKLNAVIATAPESFLLDQAHALDLEREKSGPRSRIHGIPILLKVKPTFSLTVISLMLTGPILHTLVWSADHRWNFGMPRI